MFGLCVLGVLAGSFRSFVQKCSRMHTLLILSRLAPDYRALVEAAHLPELTIAATADPAEAAAHAAACDLAFGEPALLRQVMPQLTALRWRR
jgi:hypothetical protein